MEKINNIKIWMAQIRAPFLILAVILSLLGVALTYKYVPSSENLTTFNVIILIVGAVFSHISVNLFNEYSDFKKTGIDKNTIQTPFSGGSKMLTRGLTSPKQVHFAAILALFIALVVGIYFSIISHWSILLFTIIGGLAVIFYTDFLAKISLGEIFAGLTLGTFVVLGSYVALSSTQEMRLLDIFPLEVILMSIPPGILTALLLFINEFPDYEADLKGGRKHLVIKLGKKKASYLYSVGIFITFAFIGSLSLFEISSSWVLLALLPLPLGIKAGITLIKDESNIKKMIPALGSNVITVLATDALLTVSIFLAV
jgi:1,4-dihydroxy-2-naphthoate octaprenyltransferase